MGEIEIRDFLYLIGDGLRDNSELTTKFRELIEDRKWQTNQIKQWLDECISNSKGSQDPYHKAFQDLIISLGKRLGFECEYGRYVGRQGEENYDGLWRGPSGASIVVEVKSTAWPIQSIDQLGGYVTERAGQEDDDLYGLYVIGSGDIEPLIQQIRGSSYRERIRVITKDDLVKLVALKDELEPVIGGGAEAKLQKILIPLESINLGNITNLIIEVANTRSAAAEEEAVIEEDGEQEEEASDQPWIKSELKSYLNDSTVYQGLLLAALIQADQQPTSRKDVIYLMSKIASLCDIEDIDREITGYMIAGARAGFKMRRTPIAKEDILKSAYDKGIRDKVYQIKPQYRDTIAEWVKEKGFLVLQELQEENKAA